MNDSRLQYILDGSEVRRLFFKYQLPDWMCSVHSLKPGQNQQKLNQPFFEYLQWGRHYQYTTLDRSLFIKKRRPGKSSKKKKRKVMKEPLWSFPKGFSSCTSPQSYQPLLWTVWMMALCVNSKNPCTGHFHLTPVSSY